MATKKRSKAKAIKPGKPFAATPSMPVLSTLLGSVLNMIVVAATSGTVLLLLFAAKRLA